MTKREQLQDNVEDAVFALLMEDVVEQEGKRLLEENERLKQDPSAKVPDAFDKRCRQIIRRSLARERRREAGHTLRKVCRKVALVAAVSILLFATAYATIPDVRVNTLNLLIEVSEIATSLHLSDTDKDPNIQNNPIKTNGDVQTIWGYRFPKIPEGYEILYQGDSGRSATILYSDANEKEIRFYLEKALDGLTVNVDTEDAQVDQIQIHGYDGLLIEKGDDIEVIWGDTDRGNFISVVGKGLDKTTVLNFALEMEYCG